MADKKDLVTSWEKLGITPTSISQIHPMLDICWAMKPKFTLCLVGETGIGKTPIVVQWAKKRKAYVQMLNFGHMTQEEISMIMFNEDGSEFDFVPPSFLVRLNQAAKEFGCAILYLDEWNRGDKAMVNGLFTLTDERRIHDFRLDDNVLVVAAMNPSDGSYLVNEAEKDHAIRKRLCFTYVTHELAALLKHAEKSGWHPLVITFLKADPKSLYDTGARDSGKCFPCPANWEKVSNICNAAVAANKELNGPAIEALIQGQIGNVHATRFMEFINDPNVLIKPIDVLMDYKGDTITRKRVKKLLSGANKRHDVISNLNEGIAIELFSSKPNPTDVAEHLATYISDLPSDLLGSFAVQNLKIQSEEYGDDARKYVARVTSAMSVFPQYKGRMKEMVAALNEYRTKVANTEQDPLAD